MTKFNRQSFIFAILLLAIVYIGGITSRPGEKAGIEEPRKLTAQVIGTISKPTTSLEADLNKMVLYLYEGDALKNEYKIFSKGDPATWWKTPTGKFKIGLKSEKFWSDLYLVNLPWAMQIYEDFFIHGVPQDKNGEIIPDAFSGGDLQLSDNDAQALYGAIKTGTPIFVYENDLSEIKKRLDAGNEFIPENLKEAFEIKRFALPINSDDVYIKRDFGSPIIIEGERGEYSRYVNHAGIDFAPISAEKKALEVKAAANGRAVLIQENDGSDYGLGNALILEHRLPYNESDKFVYSLYGHLKSFSRDFKIGDAVQREEIVGIMGATGFGCENFWRRVKNSCENKNSPDVYLHFELKNLPILNNPAGEKACIYQKNGGEIRDCCYEFTPNEPTRFGYLNPIEFILENL